MTPEDDMRLVQDFLDAAWMGPSLDALDTFVTPTFREHSPGLAQHNPALARGRGMHGFKQVLATLRGAFPDLQLRIDDLFAVDGRVAARLTFCGTHRAPIVGLPPTNAAIQWTQIDLYRIVDGRISDLWTERDRLGMLQQLGVPPGLPTPRGRGYSLRDTFHKGWDLYRALRPVARSWREHASLLRFILAHLRYGNAHHREVTLHLDHMALVVGLGTAEIYALPELYRERFYEREASFIAQPGWTVVDVGANIGIAAVLCARRGARVYAIEPNPACFRRLELNIAANRLQEQITPLAQALGAAPGYGRLHVPLGLTTHGYVRAGRAAGEDIAVPIITLDQVVLTAGLTDIDLLKIDVEGAEMAVLQGAAQTVARVERIIVETHAPEVRGQVEALLSQQGFTIVLRIDVDVEWGTGLLYARRKGETKHADS